MSLLFLCFLFVAKIYAKDEDKFSINFNNLTIPKLIEISSKKLNKNIILAEQIEGKVGFASNAPVTKEELFEILKNILVAKGYKIVQKNNFLKIVKITQEELAKQKENIIEIIPLNNSEAKNIMPILQAVFDNKTYQDGENKPFITQDLENNLIIASANKSQLKQIKKLISDLDRHQMQVYVEAKIIEVSQNKTKELGLRYGLSAIDASSSNIFTLGSNLGGPVNAFDSSLGDLLSIPPQTVSSAVALGATLSLLKANQAIDVVSEPSVLCVNNKVSTIYVGETKSFQTVESITDEGNINSAYQREDIGLTLKVKPRISTQNRVILEIETILEDAKALQLNQSNPDTTKKEVKTTAIVKNAESVILGGLVKSKSDVYNSKTPILGDIPILGKLFQYEDNIKDKINLVVIVTPYIIPKSKDLTSVREQLSKLKQLEEEYSVDLEKKLEENAQQKNKEENKDEKNLQKKKVNTNENKEENNAQTQQNNILLEMYN